MGAEAGLLQYKHEDVVEPFLSRRAREKGGRNPRTGTIESKGRAGTPSARLTAFPHVLTRSRGGNHALLRFRERQQGRAGTRR